MKAILLLTDGDSNTGPPVLSVAGRSRALSIPIYSVITGSDSSLPDLSLDEVFAPSFVLQEERITVNWQASNRFKTSKSTTIALFANGKKVVEKPVNFIGDESISGNLSWLPENEGEIEFDIILSQVNGETYKNNNKKRINTRVESKTIRINCRFFPEVGISISKKCFRPRSRGRIVMYSFPSWDDPVNRTKLHPEIS